MNKDAIFITEIQHLKVKEDLGKGIQFSVLEEDGGREDLFLTNNSQVIKSLINDDFIKLAGINESEYLKRAKLVVYKKFKLDSKGKDQGALLDSFLRAIKVLLRKLWRLRDHNGHFNIGFLLYNINDGIQITSNYYSGIHYSSNGLQQNILLSKQEVEEAVEYSGAILSAGSDRKQGTQLTKGLPKLTVCDYYLQVAIYTRDLAMRIAHYCTCFEALFSNDKTELSHKLSERVAYYISETPEERLDVYKALKSAYAIRSTVVHGGALNAKAESSLISLSVSCDSYLRRVFKYVESGQKADIFSMDGEEFENYFIRLILNYPGSA